MTSYIDQSVYPELDDPPTDLPTVFDQADYVHRICTAWDFGVRPEQKTFELFANWKGIFDRFPVLTSPGYHAFRAWFEWESVACPRGLILPTPRWLEADRLEGRPPDLCESMV